MRDEFMKAIDTCIAKRITVISQLLLDANGYYIVAENDVHSVLMPSGYVKMTTAELIKYTNSLV